MMYKAGFRYKWLVMSNLIHKGIDSVNETPSGTDRIYEFRIEILEIVTDLVDMNQWFQNKFYY